MVWRSIGVVIIVAGAVGFPFFQTATWAACTRADVEFYLEKGFSPAQVTAICSSPESGAAGERGAEGELKAVGAEDERREPAEKSGEPAPAERIGGGAEASGEGIPVPARGGEFSLAAAVRGDDVEVGPESLHYTTRNCTEYGEEDIYGFRKSFCPVVRFSIAYDGMEAWRSGRRYLLFGPEEIRVKGRIERRLLSGLEDLGKDERREAGWELESGDETTLPLREGISLDRVLEALTAAGAALPK